MNEHRRAHVGVGVALLTCAALIVLWPVWPGLSAVIGDPLGETDNHLWMFWSTQAGAQSNAPAGVGLVLMDPVNLPPFLLGAQVGPAFGWALLRVWNVVLAFAGGAALARCFVRGPATWVGAAVLGSSPFLMGVMDFGITESWPLGWFALHIAALLTYGRHGGAPRAIVAGVCLGMVALSGWYHAAFGLLLEACLVPVLAFRYRRVGLWWQGGIALCMVMPALMRLPSSAGGLTSRWRPPSPGPPGPRPDWAELPVFGTDLLNFVVPNFDAVHPSKSVYLGLVALGLCGLGLVHRRALSSKLGLAAALFLVLALGHWPTLAGKALGFAGPAWYIAEHLEPMRGISHWHRATAAALPFVAAMAALGAEYVVQKWGWRAAVALVALVVGDSVLGGGTAWPRSVTPLVIPASLTDLPEPGGLIQLPFDNGRTPFSETPARLYQRWQVVHGRDISENYEGIDALLAESSLIAALDERCGVPSTQPPFYQPPPSMRGLELPDRAAVAAEREQLRRWGYRYIVLHRERCRTPVQAIQALDRVLGAGEHTAAGDVVWLL